MIALTNLPLTLIRIICLKLNNRKDFLNLSLVCKFFLQTIINGEVFWQEAIRKEHPIFESKRYNTTWKEYYKLLGGYVMSEIYDGFTNFQIAMIFELMQHLTFYSQNQQSFTFSHSDYLNLISTLGLEKFLITHFELENRNHYFNNGGFNLSDFPIHSSNKKQKNDESGQYCEQDCQKLRLDWKKAEKDSRNFELETLYILSDDSDDKRRLAYDNLKTFIELYFFRPFTINIKAEDLKFYLGIIFPFGQSKLIERQINKDEDNNNKDYSILINALYKGFIVTDRNSNPKRLKYLEEKRRKEEEDTKQVSIYYNEHNRTLINYMKDNIFGGLRINEYLNKRDYTSKVLYEYLSRTFPNLPTLYLKYIVNEHIDRVRNYLGSILFNDKQSEGLLDLELVDVYIEIFYDLTEDRELRDKTIGEKLKYFELFCTRYEITKQEIFLLIVYCQDNKNHRK
jgi:hypothetical protein